VEGEVQTKKGGYKMNKKRRMSKLLSETKKSVVGRFLQLKVGHMLTGVYLERIKKKESKECWWCGHSAQTVDHLFKRCKKWMWQQDTLWGKLRKCKIQE
jgi:tRNA U54 and U55 pseudouridine synthase Pus10